MRDRRRADYQRMTAEGARSPAAMKSPGRCRVAAGAWTVHQGMGWEHHAALYSAVALDPSQTKHPFRFLAGWEKVEPVAIW